METKPQQQDKPQRRQVGLEGSVAIMQTKFELMYQQMQTDRQQQQQMLQQQQHLCEELHSEIVCATIKNN